MKMDLQIRRHPSNNVVPWKKSHPFALNSRGLLVHRVKYAGSILRDGRHSHDCVGYWCGNGSTGEHEFFDVPPESRLICARCEAAAIASGQPESDALAGKHVCKGGVKTYRTCCTNENQ